MTTKYVPAAEAYRKLTLAYEMNSAVYMYGATGYGKSRMVLEFLKDKKVYPLSSAARDWTMPPVTDSEDKRDRVCVLVDDMQLLQNEDHQEEILALAKREDICLILIGRMPTPHWLMNLVATGTLFIIPEENLRLSTEELLHIAALEDIRIPLETAKFIIKNSGGNALIVMGAVHMIKSGNEMDEQLWQRMGTVFRQHLEEQIIPKWSVGLQEFLMRISVVDSFTLPLAVMITGDDRAASLLEEAQKVGNFLFREGETYRIRPILVEALRSRAMKELGLDTYRKCVDRAGLFYEMQGDIVEALKFYEQSENKESIRSLLIRNGRRHFGDGHFYELRRYYLALEEKEAETSPVLMSALSMLYSVMMNKERSEYWYEKMKTFAAGAKGGDKREANELLIYLDIALPHRGNVDIADIVKRSAPLMLSGGIKMPEFCVTSNLPSTMNGGKDFCEWSKKDQFLADSIGKLVEILLGSFGRGVVHAALCESFYEKGGRDAEVLNHAMMTQMDVEGGGKIELLFASVGIQARLSALTGKPDTAMQLIDSFEERAIQARKKELIPNIRAFKCRLSLMGGDHETVEKWMEEAPNEMVEFWPMERFRYMTKVLCYLDEGRNTEAIALLERLRYYAEVNQRTYIRMETGLLLSMALKREKLDWRQTLLDTVNEISEYKFVRIISGKGAGILPLLKEIRKDYLEQEDADAQWYENVLKETAQVAERYPSYLNCDTAQPSDFNETAMGVLKLQAEGFSLKEIAEKLGLAERTVKYHAAENYRKLNAKGKTDAVQIARNMHLI